MSEEYDNKIINRDYDPSKMTTLDDFFSYTQDIGSLEQAGANTLYGINQTKIAPPIPTNKDTQGFVFFTRPMLNLSKWNLARSRGFHSLLSTDTNSIHRYVRCMLDPSLHNATSRQVRSPMVNNQLVFIPLLSNTILKLSGWPDVVAPVYTSTQGVRKEQWSIVDGTTEINESFDLDATFRNMIDEPISLLFKTWINYASCVFDGQLKPYAGFEVRNEIDYTTRIYRIVLDKAERYVKKIACTIASFPVNEPTGKFFDYDRQQQYLDQTKEVNVRFKCMAARYNDEIIIKWFNRASSYANPTIGTIVASNFNTKDRSKHSYVKIPHELLPRFKNHGYPIINTLTYELEWWIDSESNAYKDILGGTTPWYNKER